MGKTFVYMGQRNPQSGHTSLPKWGEKPSDCYKTILSSSFEGWRASRVSLRGKTGLKRGKSGRIEVCNCIFVPTHTCTHILMHMHTCTPAHLHAHTTHTHTVYTSNRLCILCAFPYVGRRVVSTFLSLRKA